MTSTPRNFPRTRVVGRVFAALCLLFALAVGPAPAATAADAVRAEQWWLQQYDLPAVWQSTQGAGVTVAVIDSGVDGTHPDLVGALQGGKDFSGRGAPDGLKPLPGGTLFGDSTGVHGTSTAGMIAARGHGPDHAAGFIGVAPAATVMSLSFAPTTTSELTDLPAVLRYAVDHGAGVINMSFGTEGKLDPDFGGAALQDAVAYAQMRDVVLVASSGNASTSDGGVTLPGNISGVVAVGSVDEQRAVDISASQVGPELALMAPGGTGACNQTTQAPNTLPGCSGMILPGLVSAGGYRISGGSSTAAPFVAGVVALIRSKYPKMHAADVINRLIKTAHNPQAAGQRTDTYGYGIVDPAAALTADLPAVSANPLGSVAPISGSALSSPGSSSPSPSSTASGPSSPSPSSATPATTAQTTPQTLAPATTTTAAPLPGGSPSGAGVPAWVWVVVALLVLAVAVLLVLLARRRGGGSGPGQPGGPSPAGGAGYPTPGPGPAGPPGQGYPPPGYGPPAPPGGGHPSGPHSPRPG